MRATRILGLLVLVLSLWGCTKAQRLRATAHSLNAIAEATNTAWAVSLEAALQEEYAFVAKTDPNETSFEEAQAQIQQIRDRWDERFASFRAVRHAHEAAVKTFEQVRAGESFSAIVDALGEVLRLYKALAERLGLPQPEEALSFID